MTATTFTVPEQIESDLVRIRAYWQGLIRGYADMPYWDDVKPQDLHDLQRNALLIDVYLTPLRFRFRMVGERVTRAYGQEVANKFSDEIEPRGPFHRLDPQCAAAVEKSVPTYYRYAEGAAGSPPYSRLVLPMWGNGRIEMLLGAVVWSRERTDEIRD